MSTVLSIFGTRPEAIKMAPVVRALAERPGIRATVCVTAQHRGLLDQVLALFDLKPDIDLDLMRHGQTLDDVTARVLAGVTAAMASARPDMVLVHGDTTTAMAASLAAFYQKIPVGHVEAGLRTGDMLAPFPEEMNRRVVGALASLHFAPTVQAARNLRREGVPATRIRLTGNTAIDSLFLTLDRVGDMPHLTRLFAGKRMILMTAHRRENFGAPFRNIFAAVRAFALAHPECHVVYPVHPNPNAAEPAALAFGDMPNVSLVPPVDYHEMVFLMRQAQFILTDSGGVQEEAPSLGKPILVLRRTTERPEAVAAGCAVLVGDDGEALRSHMETLLDDESPLYRRMSLARNPYGDGHAARRIAESAERWLQGGEEETEDFGIGEWHGEEWESATHGAASHSSSVAEWH